MTSKTEAGKSTTTPTARKKTARKTSAATSKAKATKTSAAKGKSGQAKTKKKKRSTKPAGPPVYASDVVDSHSRADLKKSSVLPEKQELQQEALQLSPVPEDLPMEHWPAQILQLAEEAFAMTGSWVVFYRTMLAKKGVVDQFYNTAEARRYFETTAEFAELLEMVTAIRSQDDSATEAHEPTRTITVRMPRSMHEATKREAKELELSINAYCVTKLLQPANPKFTPLESGNRRGRTPGPQITMKKVKRKKRR